MARPEGESFSLNQSLPRRGRSSSASGPSAEYGSTEVGSSCAMNRTRPNRRRLVKAMREGTTPPPAPDAPPAIEEDAPSTGCIHAKKDRCKAEWIHLLSDLQRQCHEAGFHDAEKFVCQLTTELVCNCNPPPVEPTVQVTVKKAML